ncbi:hypothetical protein ACMYSQ_011560 [Aspergillus niger]
MELDREKDGADEGGGAPDSCLSLPHTPSLSLPSHLLSPSPSLTLSLSLSLSLLFARPNPPTLLNTISLSHHSHFFSPPSCVPCTAATKNAFQPTPCFTFSPPHHPFRLDPMYISNVLAQALAQSAGRGV